MAIQNDHGRDPPELSALSLVDGELVIYDPQNHEAWVQSDAPVRLRAGD